MTVSPVAPIAAVEGTLIVLLTQFPFLTREKVMTFSLYAAGLAADSEAATSSHIEEMIQELAQ